jgi:hypothetical protein
MKNYEAPPAGAAPFLKVNAAQHNHFGQAHGRGRGRGRGNVHGHGYNENENFMLGICIYYIIAKTNILVCVVGHNVPTSFRHLYKMLDTMFQHPGTVQCAWVHPYLYARSFLFKEIIFP